MIRLPKGKVVKENIDLDDVDLPAALKTMRQGKFTGYLLFALPAGSAVFLLCQGKVIAALYEDDHSSLDASLGLEKTFLEIQKGGGGTLNVYRLSDGLAQQLLVVLGGNSLLMGEELARLNVQAVLTRMAREKRSGCLRVYSRQRVALIFYQDGHPLGFFHDGSDELHSGADVSMSVARDAGARLDILVPAEGILTDLGDLMADAKVALS